MTLSSYYKNLKYILLFIVIFFNSFSSGASTNNENESADKQYFNQLIDTALSENIYFDDAIELLVRANKVAKQFNCQTCIAQSKQAMGTIYFNNDMPDSAMVYLKVALLLYKSYSDTLGMISVLTDLSYTSSIIYDFENSIKYAQDGLKFANLLKLPKKESVFYLYMGVDYMSLGMQNKSTDVLLKALTICEAENDSVGIILSLVNLGLIFADEGNYTEALNCTNKALLISEKRKDNLKISMCLNNIGYYYSKTGKYAKALGYYIRSLELYKLINDTEGITIALNNIGDSYKSLGDTVLAVSYYTKSLELGKQYNYPAVITALINLAEVNLQRGNLNVALKFAKESVGIAESQNTIDQILSSYNILYLCYAAMGNYENAYKLATKHKQLYDSTYTIDKSKKIQEIISLYNDKQQKSEIVTLKEKSTHDFTFRMHLIQVIIVISFILVILFIIIFFVRRAKNNFKIQKRYYEKLLDRSEDFIFVVGKDGLTKYISPSYQRKIGRGIDNRLGKDSFEYIHPDDIGYVKQDFLSLAKDGKSRTLEFRIKNAFDEWIDVYAYGQNLFDDPMIQGIVVNFWDITQRKKNEILIKKNELKFRQIFEAFPDIYFQTSLDGIITEISPSVKKITGYSRDELIGLNSKEFQNFIGDWKRIEAKFRTDSFINDFDTKITKKDKTTLFCSMSVEQIFTEKGKLVGIKGVIRDISNRVANQEKLRNSQIKLKAANKSKEMLFSIISHDLIGPIGTNKSIVDMIVDQIDEFTHEEVVTLISSLKPSLDSTFSLIENLLSWSRIQQDRIKPNFDKISLNNLIIEMLQLLNGQALLKQISLNFVDTVPITIYADKNQMDVALRNLVSNAIKFSFPNNEVVISLKKNNNMALIKVKDSGIGMSQMQIDNIITKGGSTATVRGTNNEKGTGFGLIIVNEFIKNNNGKLNATSKVDEGTTFTIELPLTK